MHTKATASHEAVAFFAFRASFTQKFSIFNCKFAKLEENGILNPPLYYTIE